MSTPLRSGQRSFFLAALALACVPILPACALFAFGAGAGAGYVVTRELHDGKGIAAEVHDDVDKVWFAVLESLDILRDLKTDVIVQDSPREARATIEGKNVRVNAEAFDLDRTTVRVRASGTLGPSKKTAQRVLDVIVRQLKSKRGK